jgi:hypothetical protein
MNWTVDLTVSYVPCPPEHAAAWWGAMRLLWQLSGRATAEQPYSTLLKPDQPVTANQAQSM